MVGSLVYIANDAGKDEKFLVVAVKEPYIYLKDKEGIYKMKPRDDGGYECMEVLSN